MQLAALVVVRKARKLIQAAEFAPNNMITLAAKWPRSKPLVDSTSLVTAITKKVIDDFTAFAGVLRTAKRKGKDEDEGLPLVNVAWVLHEGATIPKSGVVTAKMRAAVFAKVRERSEEGYEWLQDNLPDEPGVLVYVIQARPFMRDAEEDPATRATVERIFRQAVECALLGLPWSPPAGVGVGRGAVGA